MAKLVIERFDGGFADDRFFEAVPGQFSAAKYFDIFTYPHRLVPTRSTTTDSGGGTTGIGNLLVASDGIIYGLGSDGANSTKLYKKADNATNWATLSNTNSGSAAINYDLFMEYQDIGSARAMLYAGNAGICKADKSNGLSIATESLTFNSISQGLVHPKDDICYIPYTTTSGTFIGTFNTSGTWAPTALTIPGTQWIITSLSWYGNYLAIALAPRNSFTLSSTGKLLNNGLGGAARSIVALWDRDTSLATVSEVIDWGTGILQVLNNLDGRLVGISVTAGPLSSNIADRNSITFKEWAGGTPQLIKEISTERQTTTFPTVTINPFVNFVYRNRLFYSIDINGGSTSPAYHGLWSMGRPKDSGNYAFTIERGATTDDSETSVLAAAATGDYFSMVYTATGTTGFSINTSSLTSAFTATSYLETCVNPGMLANRYTRHDYGLVKSLAAISVAFMPLITGQTVTLKYRADGGAWTTIVAYDNTKTGGECTSTRFVMNKAGATEFSDATFYEFRLESTGGAVITEFSYKYTVNTSQML